MFASLGAWQKLQDSKPLDHKTTMSDTIQRIFQILTSLLSIMTLFRPATL